MVGGATAEEKLTSEEEKEGTGVFIALVAVYHHRVNWKAGGDTHYYRQIVDYGIQCSNKMAVKLSYHRWHERAGRCLQLL
jgi:hypothetical protein